MFYIVPIFVYLIGKKQPNDSIAMMNHLDPLHASRYFSASINNITFIILWYHWYYGSRWTGPNFHVLICIEERWKRTAHQLKVLHYKAQEIYSPHADCPLLSVEKEWKESNTFDDELWEWEIMRIWWWIMRK